MSDRAEDGGSDHQDDWDVIKPRKRTEPIDDEERITWSVYDDLDLPFYGESEESDE